MWRFVAGMFVGGAAGFFVAALCAAAKRGDERPFECESEPMPQRAQNAGAL